MENKIIWSHGTIRATIVDMRERIFVITVIKNRSCYDRCVIKNKFLNTDEVIFVTYDNSIANIPIPIRYNDFLQLHINEDVWCVFCHEDVEFLQSIQSVIDNGLNKDVIYGVSGADDAGRVIGNMISSTKNGAQRSLSEYRVMHISPASTIDCCCLIFHSSIARKYSLHFDENLSWHLYAEDFSISARECYGVGTAIVPILCRHWSYGNKDSHFVESLAYLRQKWKRIRNFYYTATLECIGNPYRVLFATIRKKCGKFIWYRRFVGRCKIKVSFLRFPIYCKRVLWHPSMQFVTTRSNTDSFFDLVYEAAYLSPKILPDVAARCRVLGSSIGFGNDFDMYLKLMVPHLRFCWRRACWRNLKPFYFNVILAEWSSLAADIAKKFCVNDLRPFHIATWQAPEHRMTELILQGVKGGIPVIIKFSREVAETFENEFAVLCTFYAKTSVNCPRPINCFKIHGGIAIMEEKFDGVPLDEFLSAPASIVLIECVAEGLLKAIRELNSMGIIHRDLRPANVLVDAFGRVCLIDFQFALDISRGYIELPFCKGRQDVLMSIGAEYRAGTYEFCDVVSLKRILELFPNSARLDLIRDEIDDWIKQSPLKIDIMN